MLSVIIPTYNEGSNIKQLVQEVMSTLDAAVDSFEVIIVDDDSPDKTWQIAEDLAKSQPRLRVIRRIGERSLATAVLDGWKAAKGEILGVMDGDLQHDPKILGKLFQAISTDSADIVIASRHVKDGGVSDWSLIRRSISWGATCLATMAIPGILRNVRDPMSGYFMLKRSVIESARLNPIGYKILLEVLVKGSYRGVQEIPYIFEERKEGSSKLGARQYGEYLLHLTRLARDTGELYRLLCFCAVGVTGVIVNEAVLWWLTSFGTLHYIYASLAAVEVAMFSNFVLNEFWTFRDSIDQSAGIFGRFRRLLKFNLICAIGGLLNTAALWILTGLAGRNYLVSNLVGIGIAAVWNYAMNANITWETKVPVPLGAETLDRTSLESVRNVVDPESPTL
jgi:dolichol-phosphate mannosyltransferase